MNKEVICISIGEPIQTMGKPKLEDKKNTSFRDATKKHPTIKELQEKKYPFPNLDLSSMLDGLLEKAVIQLPKPKHLEKV